jgi:hypothetical protein
MGVNIEIKSPFSALFEILSKDIATRKGDSSKIIFVLGMVVTTLMVKILFRNKLRAD